MNNMNTYHTNYSVAIHWCNNSYVMCNNLPEIDPSIWYNMMLPIQEYVEEEEDVEDMEEEPEYREIFQWFITNASSGDVNYLMRTFPGLIFTYSDLLDCYVLCVDHYGTSWDYVDWVTTNKNAEAELGKRKQDL